MIKITFAGRDVPFKAFTFNGGERHIRLENPGPYVNATFEVEARMTSPYDIIDLLLVTDALRQAGTNIQIDLLMPYVPYARQDRVCAVGEPLSARVFCDLINSQGYNLVEIWDAHSDVVPALLNRVRNIPSSHFVGQLFVTTERVLHEAPTLVAPDAGALKKVGAIAKLYGLEVIRADKTRDTKTGEITGTVVYSDYVCDTDLLVVDDICDGGRTFLELAKAMRPLTSGKLILYVTHGIFSNGLDELGEAFDLIVSPNVFAGVPNHPKLRRL